MKRKWSFYFSLGYAYFKATLKTNLQYKFDRFAITFAVFFRELANVIIIILMLNTFKEINGWNMNEILFQYSFLFMSYSLFILFFTGIRDFEEVIYSGDLDIYLFRPVSVLYQVIVSKIDYTAAVGHGCIGIILFVMTAGMVNVEWDPLNICYLFVCIISGAVLQAAIFLLSSCFSFWTIKTKNIRNLIFFSTRKFSAYPISFYPGMIKKILIFVIPFAFVNYYPTQFYLKKSQLWYEVRLLPWFSPLVAFILFFGVYLIWKTGLKRYSSTGNAMM